jgi:hypothetical protein
MAFPTPVPGLVVRYSFLWSHEARAGAEEGRKDRPCAVLLTMRTQRGRDVVTVLPITHSPPDDPALAVEIPLATKRRLGLDGERSWIILSEANRFFWPGPDLRPIPGGDPDAVAYGQLPEALYDIVREKWLEAFDKGRAGQIARSE